MGQGVFTPGPLYPGAPKVRPGSAWGPSGKPHLLACRAAGTLPHTALIETRLQHHASSHLSGGCPSLPHFSFPIP